MALNTSRAMRPRSAAGAVPSSRSISAGVQILLHSGGSSAASGSTSTPSEASEERRATATTQSAAQWEIDPSSSSGQRGVRSSLRSSGTPGWPSCARSPRAQRRPAANSRRRFATARATSSCSSGSRSSSTSVTGQEAVHTPSSKRSPIQASRTMRPWSPATPCTSIPPALNQRSRVRTASDGVLFHPDWESHATREATASRQVAEIARRRVGTTIATHSSGEGDCPRRSLLPFPFWDPEFADQSPPATDGTLEVTHRVAFWVRRGFGQEGVGCGFGNGSRQRV